MRSDARALPDCNREQFEGGVLFLCALMRVPFRTTPKNPWARHRRFYAL